MTLPVAFPTPNLFDAQRSPALGWGIIGPGWIASEFASALRQHTRQQLTSVVSRTSERAEHFAAHFEIGHHTSDLDAMLGRDDVDVVYIAAPQSEHARLALAAVAAGKHVLVEKPFAISVDDAHAVVEAAREAGVFAMEGLWSRYLPQASVIRSLIADGVLGDMRAVLADQGQGIPPGHRLRDPASGGGALLDLGIYAVALSSEFLGEPSRIVATGTVAETGVDSYATVALEMPEDRHATISTNIEVRTPGRAVIAGTAARIELGGRAPFHSPTNLVLADPGFGTTPMEWADPTGVTRFGALSWEANAVARFIGEGRIESPLHSLDETVRILATVEEARRQILEGRRA
jgi:predicted dehydrogenase